MLATKIEDAKREEGFTLIELLVVVIIIGILAAIAIPVFLNQRQNAWRGSAESDARNAAISMESIFTSTRQYPANATMANAAGATPLYCASSATPSVISAAGAGGCAATDVAQLTISNGVTLAYVVAGDGNSYTITASHVNVPGQSIIYNSATGGLADAWTNN